MKVHTKLFISASVLMLCSAGSAQANINTALQQVCVDSIANKADKDSTDNMQRDHEQNTYYSRLNNHFNLTSCDGKRMLEASRLNQVEQVNQSEVIKSLAAAPN